MIVQTVVFITGTLFLLILIGKYIDIKEHLTNNKATAMYIEYTLHTREKEKKKKRKKTEKKYNLV